MDRLTSRESLSNKRSPEEEKLSTGSKGEKREEEEEEEEEKEGRQEGNDKIIEERSPNNKCAAFQRISGSELAAHARLNYKFKTENLQ